jgi:hypothetical protein
VVTYGHRRLRTIRDWASVVVARIFGRREQLRLALGRLQGDPDCVTRNGHLHHPETRDVLRLLHGYPARETSGLGPYLRAGVRPEPESRSIPSQGEPSITITYDPIAGYSDES